MDFFFFNLLLYKKKMRSGFKLAVVVAKSYHSTTAVVPHSHEMEDANFERIFLKKI
jgi:hypothetical protein